MVVALLALTIYGLGLVLTAVGSRLAGRCAAWCAALCGFPLWVVGGTVAAICLALPQLTLAFLASGLSITALAVGAALAGAVTDLGLVFALCLLRRSKPVLVDGGEFTEKAIILVAACLVLVFFVRDGSLSYTGTGLLMLLFVIFVLRSIMYQYRFLYGGSKNPISSTGQAPDQPLTDTGYTAHTMAFPVMSVLNSLKNLGGILLGMALLAGGAQALVFSAATLANLTGTIQALWAATLISFGFCLPLLAEVLGHPLGSIWKKFAERCRFYPAAALPMQMLNSAILSLTLALPLSSLMYRQRLPVGAQFRQYEVPMCLLMALVLLLPALLKKRLYRWQGVLCLALYLLYIATAILLPLAGA